VWWQELAGHAVGVAMMVATPGALWSGEEFSMIRIIIIINIIFFIIIIIIIITVINFIIIITIITTLQQQKPPCLWSLQPLTSRFRDRLFHSKGS
jgi:hypothetical protein